jgi:hypothetical protein
LGASGKSRPSETFERLKERVKSPRKKANLELLWRVLSALHEDGATDFSVARVGRRLEEVGGPRTQSIRNKGGAEYRELIDAFVAAYSKQERPGAKTLGSQLEDAIGLIPNAALQAALRIVVSDNKKLKHENDRLRYAFSKITIDVDAELERNNGTDGLDGAHERLDPEFVRTLQLFVSDDWMSERGLRATSSGAVVLLGSDDLLIAPPGFVNAVKHLVDRRE